MYYVQVHLYMYIYKYYIKYKLKRVNQSRRMVTVRTLCVLSINI